MFNMFSDNCTSNILGQKYLHIDKSLFPKKQLNMIFDGGFGKSYEYCIGMYTETLPVNDLIGEIWHTVYFNDDVSYELYEAFEPFADDIYDFVNCNHREKVFKNYNRSNCDFSVFNKLEQYINKYLNHLNPDFTYYKQVMFCYNKLSININF